MVVSKGTFFSSFLETTSFQQGLHVKEYFQKHFSGQDSLYDVHYGCYCWRCHDYRSRQRRCIRSERERLWRDPGGFEMYYKVFPRRKDYPPSKHVVEMMLNSASPEMTSNLRFLVKTFPDEFKPTRPMFTEKFVRWAIEHNGYRFVDMMPSDLFKPIDKEIKSIIVRETRLTRPRYVTTPQGKTTTLDDGTEIKLPSVCQMEQHVLSKEPLEFSWCVFTKETMKTHLDNTMKKRAREMEEEDKQSRKMCRHQARLEFIQGFL